MAETHAGHRAKPKSHSPSLFEILNPFEPGTVGTGVEEIGKKTGTAAETAGGLVAGHKGEEVGEELTHKAEHSALGALGELGKGIAEGIGALIGAFGIRLGEILAGAGLLLFGLVVIGREAK